jgi:Tfp pilus assembly protein PilE
MSAHVTLPRHVRDGITLIELLTSVALGLVLSVLATVSFLQVRGVLQRAQVRLEMHNSARFLSQALSEQFAALQQDGAMWIETTKNDGSANGFVTITFLKGKTDEHDYTTSNGNYWNGEQNAVYQNRCTDLAWSSWKWDQKKAILYTGTNSPPRQFFIQSPWSGPQGNYQGIWMANMPQPWRSATPYPAATPIGSSSAALSGNRYGSPDTTHDFSDYQDLLNQMSPVVRNVTGCVFELILDDGSVVDADVTQTRTLPLDGSYVDAHATADSGSSSFPFKKRPRLIRLLIDMTDPVTNISQSFSLSFQPPGMLPLSYPVGSPIP